MRKFKNIITTEKELRATLGHPSEKVTDKVIDHIDSICQKFIAASPFLIIASSDGQSNFDMSPKGDPKGFAQVLDKKTIVIPDRLGNKRADTLTNLFQNPKVGLIFFIPGVSETLRVSGTARIIADEDLRKKLACKGKLPQFVIAVHVEEVFMHCAKCMIRSELWKGELTDKNKVPSLAKAMVDHGKLDLTYKEMDDIIKNDETTRLY